MDTEKVCGAGSAEIDTRKDPEATSVEMVDEVAPAKMDIEKAGDAALAKMVNVVNMDIEKVGEAASPKIVSAVTSAEKNVKKVGEAAAKMVSVAASAKNNIEKVGEAVSTEIDMEKVRDAASAHYKGLSEDQKQAALRFFEAMDTDKSGNISIDEFVTFMGLFGFQSGNHDWLFAKLDKDDNGTLDFNELVTFFYILGRDEYKHLVDSRPSTDTPRRKKCNKNEVAQLYKKLQGAYKLRNWGNENACCIL